jgi:hypothetical protein
MTFLLIVEQTLVTHGYADLENGGLLYEGERHPHRHGWDLTLVEFLWLSHLNREWSNHRWGLLSNHQSPTDTPAGIVAKIQPKWEGGIGL